MSKMELTVQDCMKIIERETKDNKSLILVLGTLMAGLLYFQSIFLALLAVIIVALLYWSQVKKSNKGIDKKFLIKIDACVGKEIRGYDSTDSCELYYIFFMDNGEVKIRPNLWLTAEKNKLKEKYLIDKCLYDSIEKTDKCFLLCLESDVNVYAIFPTKDFELKLDEFVEKSGIYYPTI